MRHDGSARLVSHLRISAAAAVAVAVLFGLSAATAPGGTGRSLTTHFDATAAAVAIQPNGMIVAAGSAGASLEEPSDFAVARYRADGRLDRSFGAGGKALTSFGSPVSGASAEALQGDGKIVTVGRAGAVDAGPSGVALARYRPNGSLDPGFGSGGKVVTTAGSTPSRVRASASAVALQGDGRIVVAGTSVLLGTPPHSSALVARYLRNGRLDPSFRDGGTVEIGFGGQLDGASAVAIQQDDKIVVAGSAYGAGPPLTDIALARLLPDGMLDQSFGVGGKVLTAFGSDTNAVAEAIAIQDDGKIVVAGWSGGGAYSPAMTLVRYLPNGDLDHGFGSGGKVVTGLGASGFGSGASAVAIQADGRIVVAGWTAPGAPRSYFALARYLSDGTVDPGFGGGGNSVFPAAASSVAVQGNGKIVAAGRGPLRQFTNSGYGFMLARYRTDGGLDTAFGKAGTLATDFTPATSVAAVSATRTKRSVRVRWRTLAEADTSGFNVYRQTSRGRVRANRGLIAARGSAETGASYAFLDRRAPRTARRYWVQEVKADGKRSFYGPAAVRR